MAAQRISHYIGVLSRFLAKAKKRLIFDGYERKKEPKAFAALVAKAIQKQTRAVATTAVVERIVEAVSKVDDSDVIGGILEEEWSPAANFLSKDKTMAFLIWSGEQGGKNAAQLMGLDGTFRLKNSAIKARLNDRQSFLIDSMDEANKESLRVAFQEGISEHLSTTELQQYIFDKVDAVVSPYKAEMIARTEFANAAGEVQKETYKQNGVEQVQWVFVGDTCDICEPNDGEVRRIGDEFPSGDTAEPAHPNCKCSLIPVIPDDFDTSDAWLGD